MALLKILSAVSGIPEEAIFNKFHFRMTDSTSHNMEVELLLSAELNSSHVPKHLLCHVHPVFLFLRLLDALFKNIEESIEHDKIFASFNVTPDSQVMPNTTVTISSHD